MAFANASVLTTVGTWDTGSKLTPMYLADFLRANLYPNLYFRQFGNLVTVPRGWGHSVKIPRWQTPIILSSGYAARMNSLSAVIATAALGAPYGGTTVPMCSTALGPTILSGSLSAFAGIRKYTDKLVLTSRADWMEAAIESLGRELALRFDNYTRAKISATYGMIFATSANAKKITCPSPLFGKHIAKIAPWLDARGVPRRPDGSFTLMIHPLAQYDLLRDTSATGFISVKRYHDPEEIYRGEIGQMYGVRIICSSNIQKITASKTGSSTTCFSAWAGISAGITDGFNGYAFGDDPFYTLEYEGAGVELIHHELGSSGAVSDPINQIGSIGIKAEYGVIPQDRHDQRVVRVAHTSTLV